eukprot:SAG31_NODE_2009_length_6673_cov_3.370094_2_plen_83_part_00
MLVVCDKMGTEYLKVHNTVVYQIYTRSSVMLYSVVPKDRSILIHTSSNRVDTILGHVEKVDNTKFSRSNIEKIHKHHDTTVL